MKFTLFLSRADKDAKGYKGVSDFMLNAPADKKVRVFTEVTRRATKEQRRLLDEVGVSLTPST